MNDYNQWNNSGPNTVYMNEKFQYETLSNYTAKTFLWMFAGLLVTFGVSLAAYMSNIGFYLLRSSFTFFGLAILEIVLVVALAGMMFVTRNIDWYAFSLPKMKASKEVTTDDELRIWK